MNHNQPRKQSDWHMPVVETASLVRPKMSKTPEAVAERKRMALHLVAQGRNKSQIAREMGVDRSTVQDWYKVDPNFKEQWDRITAERDEMLAEEFEDLAINVARGTAKDADGNERAYTKDGMPNYSAVRDILKVTNRNRWGDKKEISHSGTVIHTLIPQARRLDELPEGDVIDISQVVPDEEDE